jgi:hypothetical protein
LGADHSHHATVAEETAKANEEAAKAEAGYTEVQAERDLAFIHLRTLYRALESSGGDILSDEVLEHALGQIVRLRANVRVLEDANASFVGGMRGAPKVADASMGHLAERAALCPNGSAIVDECIALAAMLVEKNIAYGDSALSPMRVFAKGIDAKSQILVRLDDKLSRLARGSAAGEDVILDLLGYLILYRIASAK